jgi:hypothetical protein
MTLAYCDMIAYAIKETLPKKTDDFISVKGGVQFDLAEEGYMQSTTKFINVYDVNGKKYKITVEEAD